jgi:AraC-like DNA-binding protein
LPISKEDENWGLTVLNAGCTRIQPANAYPGRNHPAHHNFDWKAGRVLQEFQVIYITNGLGIFESENQLQTEVKAGTIMLLFPNERHRYKPDVNTGWDEYWIGIKGPVIENLLTANYFTPKIPCIYIGFQKEIVDLFTQIVELTKLERTGYQPAISGAAYYLLGLVHTISKQMSLAYNADDEIVKKAQVLFRSNINSPYSPEQAAKDLNVGYSWFRKRFKTFTGLSPGQYYIQLKIEDAKWQLASTGSSVKKIAYDLNFESAFYFSKIFKEKTGMTPTQFKALSTPL